METATYNGWKNYETWCVNLWLTNDQDTCDEVCGLWQSCERTATATSYATAREIAIMELADALKELVSGWNPLESLGEEPTMFSDLLGAALAEVDWREIAESVADAYSQED